MTAIDIGSLRDWIGREETARDVVTPRLVALFRATLDPHLAPLAEAAPLGIHWCLSPPEAPTTALGPDGHPARGDFLPPVPLPRRMWAGGEIELLDALRVGDEVERCSSVADLRMTEGRSGTLCFVTVQHALSTARGPAIRERQDIVYRETRSGSTRAPEGSRDEPACDLEWNIAADPPLLFRYSAITFNSHRIHYDVPYATTVEGYPGLLVHGPLQATLLLHLGATLEGRPPHRFRYRGVAPLFGGQPLHLRAARTPAGVACWSANREGGVGMKAEAEFVE